jgi:mono/diheme cytochrome c family protein
MRIGTIASFVCSITWLSLALPPANCAADPAFQAAVEPVFRGVCLGCHNQQLASGGMNIQPFLDSKSLTESREGWDIILQKLRAGEMPPAGMPKPAKLDALIAYVQSRLDEIDKSVKPDPGRVVAHRLNRYEYMNTVRDLLAVDFQADKNFPTDDSGYGFDNIGSVLTVSPLLMSKYMNAAQKIASRAMALDPLPKPIEAEYSNRNKNTTKPERGVVEAQVRIDFDGDYTVRFGLQGERPPDGKPVDLSLSVDGKVVHTMSVETKPSKLVYFDPYSEEKMTVHLTEGEHTVRAQFLNDDFAAALSDKDFTNRKKNKYIDALTFIGPFASAGENASRKKILICEPKSGAACVQKIIANLANHAYRRPATSQETAAISHFVDFARAQGQSVEQGIQLAIQAMLVSPNFLFKIENGTAASQTTAAHPVSDYELASRLSYFLWSSMPDDELLGLAAQGKLHDATVLDTQMKRMLADSRSGALASNFAGQWLETRNLDVVKPDPQKFPEWNSDLRDDMKSETRMFFEYVLRENRPITDFLDARYTFLDERLAKFYGITDVKGPEFRRVDLTTDQRGGVLGQAAVLTVSSYPTRTSVVLRGKFILDNILSSPVLPPPPDVPPLDEAAVGKSASLRQQMEKHRADPACATCHNKMDPLGFGLENYNAIGKWRTQDGNFPVDATGTLPSGKAFATPAEMRSVLTTGLPEFSQCLTQKMLTYALERGLQPFDRRTEADIERQLTESNYSFQTLIYGIVHSLPFQQSRGEAPAPRQTVTAKTNPVNANMPKTNLKEPPK